MREVLTLQFGGYANYVGAHFWNLQDEAYGRTPAGEEPEIKPRILYRVGQTPKGKPVATPRVLIFDMHGASGALSLLDAYGSTAPVGAAAAQIATWGGSVQEIREAPVQPHWYTQSLHDDERADEDADGPAQGGARAYAAWKAQQRQGEGDGGEEGEEGDGGKGEEGEGAEEKTADAATAPPPAELTPLERRRQLGESVRFWSDYCKVLLHPRSVRSLPRDVEPTTFDTVAHGVGSLRTVDPDEAMCDSVRFFAEECDRMQGFHTLVDTASGGFVGLAADMLEYVREEFPKVPVVTFGVEGHDAALGWPPRDARHNINTAVSLALLRDSSALYVPLSTQHARSAAHFPLLRPDLASPFHTAALLAAAIDTATLPYRVSAAHAHAQTYDMVRLVATRSSMNVASLGMALPLPHRAGASLHRLLGEAPEFYQRGVPGALLADLTLAHAHPRRQSMPFSESLCMRGLPAVVEVAPITPREQQAFLRKAMMSRGAMVPYSYAPYEQPAEVLHKMMFRYKCHTANRAHHAVHAPLGVPVAFPALFDARVCADGQVDDDKVVESDVESAPALTHLSTTPALHPTLCKLGTYFDSRIAQHFMVSAGMETDDLAEHRESLLATADAYEEGVLDSDSEESDDSVLDD